MNSEIGRQYGYLTVIEDTGRKYHSTKIYKCRCVCGKIVEVNANKLHTGHVKSCGCRRFRWKDLTGQRFGRLTVPENAYTKNKKNFWKCRCDCGNVCYVQTSWLTNGTTVSCGCKNDENRASLQSLDRGPVNGTMVSGIQKGRKKNRNNTSGVTGVHYDTTVASGSPKSCSSVRPICSEGSRGSPTRLERGKPAKRSTSGSIDKMGAF